MRCLRDGGHIERPADEKWRLRLSFVTLDEIGFFSRETGLAAFRRRPDSGDGHGRAFDHPQDSGSREVRDAVTGYAAEVG